MQSTTRERAHQRPQQQATDAQYELCSEHRIYDIYMLSSERAVGEAETKWLPSAVAVYHAVMLRVVSTYMQILICNTNIYIKYLY